MVSCVTKDFPYKPHPHSLVGKESCKKSVCTLEIKEAVESPLGSSMPLMGAVEFVLARRSCWRSPLGSTEPVLDADIRAAAVGKVVAVVVVAKTAVVATSAVP